MNNTERDTMKTIHGNSGIARALTFDLMTDLEQAIYQATGLEPDALVCSLALARKYENRFERDRDGRRYWRGKRVLVMEGFPDDRLLMVSTDRFTSDGVPVLCGVLTDIAS